MKMTKFFSVALVASVIALTSCSETQKAPEVSATTTTSALTGKNSLAVDNSSSSVSWRGEMLGGLYGHQGTVDIKESQLEITDGTVSGGSFTIDLTTITPTDNNYNPAEGKTPENLKGHLSSPDFFDVENHPTASFVITSMDGNTAKGNLTVRGVTHEEIIENVIITPAEDFVSVKGKLTFDRQKYGVAYSVPAKDVVLSDNIQIDINLNGKI